MNLKPPTLLLMSALSGCTPAMAQDVSYRETFPTGDHTRASGWHYHMGATAVDLSGAPAWGGAPGATIDAAVNSLPGDESAAWKGFLWLAQGDRYLLWTDEAVITTRPSEISWFMSLDEPDATVRVAVQIDTNKNGRDANDGWFVSDQTFSQVGAKGIDKADKFTLNFGNAKWRPLDFKPGNEAGGGSIPAQPGEATALPDGAIVAFGFYGAGKTKTHAFDTVTVLAPGGSQAIKVVEPLLPTPKNLARDLPLSKPTLTRITEDYQMDNVAIAGGGFFTGVEVHPTVPDLLWARSDVQGPWKRTAADDRWRLMTFSNMQPFAAGAAAVAMHPQNPNLVFAEIGGGRFNMGLWKSIDGGKNWKRLIDAYSSSNEGEERHWGRALMFDPNNSNVIYWGTRRSGIYRSMDGGNTWKVVHPHMEGAASVGTRTLAVDPSAKIAGRSKTIYISVHGHGLLCSTDGGESFAPVPEWKTTTDNAPDARSLRVANDGTLYASYGTTAKGAGIARFSPREGWSRITPPGTTSSKGLDVLPTNSNDVVAMVDYTYPEDAMRTGWGILRSRDGGKTWMQVLFSSFGGNDRIKGGDSSRWWYGPTLAPEGVTFDPHYPGRVYINDPYAIWKCEDIWAAETTWQQFSQGAENIITIMLESAPATPDGAVAPLYSGVSDVRGFRHTDIFDVPSKTVSAPGEWVSYVNGFDVCQSQPKVQMAAKFGFNNTSIVIRSEDGGQNWKQVTDPLPGKNHGGAKIAMSATDPNRAVILFGANNGLRFTTDGGQTWQMCRVAGTGQPLPGFHPHDFAYNFARFIAADKVDGNTFYAYRKEGGVMWVSRDGGATWSPSCDLPDVEPHDDISPLNVVAMPGRAGEVWVALSGNGIYRSTDYGQNFTRVLQFAGSRPNLVSFGKPAPGRPDNEPTIYILGQAEGDKEVGIYRSTDMGRIWQVIDRKLHGGNLGSTLTADRQNFGRIYLGSAGIYFLQPNQNAPVISALPPLKLTSQGGELLFTAKDQETSAPGLVARIVGNSNPALLRVVRLERVPENPGQWRLRVQRNAGKTGDANLRLEVSDGNLAGFKTTPATIKVSVTR